MIASIWDLAAAAADLKLDLPDLPGGRRNPLFLRRIPAGSFLMGARGENADEEPRHEVAIEEFYLGTFVVTQEQWREVAERFESWRERSDPSHFKGLRRPVESVSWDDAAAWLEELMKLPRFPAGMEARLPTEAEWEYACRAGTETDYYNGDGEAALAEVAWYDDNAGGETHAVDEPVAGRVEAHPWGLYGMHGNVSEWCRDVYGEGTYRARADGVVGPEETLREGEARDFQLRVFRGGSWGVRAWRCRSACRVGELPFARYWNQGFRVCLAPRSGGSQLSGTETEPAKAKPGAGDGGGGKPPESDTPGAAGAGGDAVDLTQERLPPQPTEK